MDKEKIIKMIKDAEHFTRDIEAKFPKTRNLVNNLGWKLREIKEELGKPDELPKQETIVSV